MRTIRLSGRTRLRVATMVALVCAFASVAPTSAVVVIRSTGETAPWETADSDAQPGAHCRYEGAAGSWFLRSLRGNSVGVLGTESQPRSVGYRLLLQRQTPHGWKTTQRGTLITNAATQSSPALLPRSRIRRDPDESPNKGHYRLALKVVWYDQHANVQGVEVAYVVRHQRSFDDSLGPSCRARVPTLM
jgi:hypothetical protein